MSEQSKPLVVGVDGSRAALAAACWAAGEAVEKGASLRLVSVVPAGPVAGSEWEAFPNDVAADFAAGGREHVEAAGAVVAEHAPQLSMMQAVLEGRPAAVLVRESREANRLVLGARGVGELGAAVSLSTTEAVVAHAHCPVAVVREDASSPGLDTGPIVVGLDGSTHGWPVMAEACEAAYARGVELVAVRTWSDTAFEGGNEEAVAAVWQQRRGAEQVALEQELGPWRERFPTLVLRAELARDRPAHALLHRSGRAQLLVVGGRGRGGLPGMQLGSTARVLVHACPCPLLVVPTAPVR